jgi:tetratricopeptide (TPR) repeat protein
MEALNEVGATFHNLGLLDQAVKWYQKVIDLDKKHKMNNYFMLAKATLFIAHAIELNSIQKALQKNLEALELCKKGEANLFIARIYANLIRLYSKTGDMSKADEAYSKLIALPQALIDSMYSRLVLDVSLAVYFAAKNQQEISNQHLERHIAFIKNSCFDSKMLLQCKPNEAWILSKQGKTEQAKQVLKEIQEGLDDLKLKFEKTNLQSTLMAKQYVTVGAEFEIRIDIFNVGNQTGKILQIEDICPTNFIICNIQPVSQTKNKTIILNEAIGAFEDKVFKIQGYSKKEGLISLKPRITYLDSNGIEKINQPTEIQIIVQPSIKEVKQELNIKLTDPITFDFKQVESRKSFEYLVKAFFEDYKKKKFLIEKSGWRSLVEVSKATKIPRSYFYNRKGRVGLPIAELERRGLVDLRIFTGERGRGGKVIRIRINVERDIIEQFIKNKLSINHLKE